MGNLNAKVGIDNAGIEEVTGRHGHGEMNENGEKFAHFCATKSLVIGGTLFPHKRIHGFLQITLLRTRLTTCAYRESLGDHSWTSEP